MVNIVRLSDIYVTSICIDGNWQVVPLSAGPVYQALDYMEWVIHDDYVLWLKQFNDNPYITTTQQYKKLFIKIKKTGLEILESKPITFKNVYEYVNTYETCKLPKQINWLWIIKDGQHRLACLYYLHKNMNLVIDKDHVVTEIIYG